MISSILAPLFVMGTVVCVHEFGHYISAVLVGIHVEEFAFGFGKVLWQKVSKKGTKFQLRLVPLGGYVKMLGNEDAIGLQDSSLDHLSNEDKKKSFAHRSNLVKIWILLAGPLANYLFALVILFTMFISFGKNTSEPVIMGFYGESVAQNAGMQIDDIIISVDDVAIKDVGPLQKAIALKGEKPMKISYMRGQSVYEIHLTPTKNIQKASKGAPMYSLGILTPPRHLQKISIFKSLQESVYAVYDISATSLKVLSEIITFKRTPKDLGGPIQIFQQSAKTAQDGFISLVIFISFISVSLGFANLLPIPLLDGGQVLLHSVEVILRRKFSHKIISVYNTVGIVAVASLMIFAIVNDVAKFFV